MYKIVYLPTHIHQRMHQINKQATFVHKFHVHTHTPNMNNIKNIKYCLLLKMG